MQTRTRTLASLLLLAGLGAPLVALPSQAAAQETASETGVVSEGGPIYERGGLAEIGLVAGLKGAVGFGQLFSDMELGWIGELELGWVTPYRPLQIFVTTSYVRTGQADALGEPDPRLPSGGAWTYDVTQDQLVFTVGPLYRLDVGSDVVVPYGALGFRTYLTSTEVTGEADADFGTYEEQGTDFGAYGAIGADFFVGPGAFLTELQIGWAPVDRYVLQDTSTGTLNLALGYRFFF